MNWLARATIVMLAYACSSGRPVRELVTLSVDVEGIEALAHRPLLLMGAGGPYSFPCDRATAAEIPFTKGRFALYEDGLAIYTRTVDHRCVDMEAHLTRENAQWLADRFAEAGFSDLPGRVDIGCTDQPHVSIRLRRGVTWHEAAVIGVTRFGEHLRQHPFDLDPVFVTMLRRIADFDVPSAVPWMPREVRVQLEPVDPPIRSWQRQVQWPLEMDPPSESHRGGRFAFYDASRAEPLRALLSEEKRPVVEWGGRLWSYQLQPDIPPEHEFIERVDSALRSRASELYP